MNASPIFILPTKGSTPYRGKYPTRARFTGGDRISGYHVELNNGIRLWCMSSLFGQALKETLRYDYAESLNKATPMLASQYETMKEAAELRRTVKEYAGHGKRAQIEEQVTAMLRGITANIMHNGEWVNEDAVRAAKPSQLTLDAGESVSELTGQPVKVRTIDCTPTWSGILPGLLAVMENGTGEGRRMAREELAKMARLADERNELAQRLAESGK